MLTHDKCITVKIKDSKIKERNKDLALLLNLSNRVMSVHTLKEVLDEALKNVLAHFKLKSGRIYFMDEKGEFLRLAAYKGMKVKGLEKINIDEGFSGKAVRTKSIIAQYVSELKDKNRARILAEQGLDVVICIPLMAMDKVIGVLNLGCSKNFELNQQIIDFLVIVGNLIAVAVNNARFYHNIRNELDKFTYMCSEWKGWDA